MKMALSIFLIVVVLAAAGGALIYASSSIGVSQAAQPTQDSPEETQTQPASTQITPTVVVELAAPTSEPTRSPTQTVEQFLEIVKTKGEEKADELLGQPGWVHHVQTTASQPNRPGSTLANGDVIPEEFTLDSWYYIDAEGTYLEGVTYMRDSAGNAIQSSVIHNGIGYNITLDWENELYDNKIYADDPFYRSLLSAEAYGFDLTVTMRKEEAATGEVMIIVTASDIAESPATIDNGDTVVKTQSSGYYTEDGTLTKIVGGYVTDEGIEVVNAIERTVLFERVAELPAEVLALYEQY